MGLGVQKGTQTPCWLRPCMGGGGGGGGGGAPGLVKQLFIVFALKRTGIRQ